MNEIEKVKNYYRKVAGIYDGNRRFFLFGRKRLIQELSTRHTDVPKILEVGCGTGMMLLELCRNYPNSQIIGLDLSEHMLAEAERKTADLSNITLVQRKFDAEFIHGHFDLIVFSYALSVFPDLEATLDYAKKQLVPGGLIALTDFFDSDYTLFKLWISRNISIRTHFSMSVLTDRFKEKYSSIHRAYLGFWKYFLFIGCSTD